MIRRTVVLLITAGVVLAAAAAPGWAQRRMDTSPVRLYVDLGYVNLFSYPKWMTIGPELELRLGRHVHDRSRRLGLDPAIGQRQRQARARGDSEPPLPAFLRRRGGRSAGSATGANVGPGWLVPKVQVGYFAGPTRLTVSALYLNTTKDVILGMTIGFGIGRRSRD